ncbi:hypothetical protein NCCP2222_19350 [Sporosarcina sp. NCCP-2222]|uniref:helicase C-terminal domain-containing protein n=1 Tax=Sporosarcina sp. NCCP-2222 TaxID=2935073 RepID=UPI00208D4F5F|nr:helicase C-terminal domain-containing protein [Sporosarcina sp. NCCP-2222]GKV55988.1 hypothetical protein NCCP2222_19350 [Sporosarcina sp. NCCP-2222]
MAFKIPGKSKFIPTGTIELFNKLKRLERLSLQQGESLQDYEKFSGKDSDIAIEMPAGHGKTLVGGLIGEFNRLNKGKRVVYCCATRQLAAQTNQLLETYGIESVLLVKRVKDFNERDLRKYRRSDAIAVTTYSHIFNTNSAFKDSQIIIFDDAHATEYSINDLWTLEINKKAKDQTQIFNAMYAIVKDLVPKSLQDKIDLNIVDPRMDAVDIIPQPLWFDRIDDIKSYLNTVAVGDHELSYSWSKIRDIIHGCQMYISKDKITLKPLIMPNSYHDAFCNASERIYMSATLGATGELEKIFGVPEIKRISKFSKGANKVSGRRLILFPEDHFEMSEIPNVLIETIKMQPRVLMLFPSKDILNKHKDTLEKELPGYTIFLSEDIEDSLDSFKSSQSGILMLAGRYEGIDLKDDECRLQIFYDLPVSVGVSEQFLQSRLRVNEILKSRLVTRVTQGLGRCTRGNQDYAAILFLGKNVGEYLYKNDFRNLLPSEIEAELDFGLSQIDEINDIENWKASLSTFFEQNEDWDEADDHIKSKTIEKEKEREIEREREKEKENNEGEEGEVISSDTKNILEEIYAKEINFQYYLFDKNFEKANKEAFSIIKSLGRSSAYKEYRAWWNYNLACIFKQMGEEKRVVEYIERSLNASTNKIWIARELFSISLEQDDFHGIEIESQLEQILTKLYTFGDRDQRFEKDWDKIMKGLQDVNANIYEPALRDFGAFLGLITDRPEGKGTPDSVWNFGDQWLVFEAKTNIEDPSKPISLEDIRQTGFHEKWLRTNYQHISEDATINTIMLCERKYIEEYAMHATDDVYLVSPSDLVEKAVHFGDVLRTTIQKIKFSTQEDAKKTLVEGIIEKNLTVNEFTNWLKTTELKTCVKIQEF